MDDDKEMEMILLLGLYWLLKRRKNHRSTWVCPIFVQRCQFGEYNNLLQEMRVSDPESHFRYIRMSKETFDSLLAQVGTSIIISNCNL